MKCPECGTTEGIKWFLRHQKENEEDESTVANVITMLCTKCGCNESYFLEQWLDDIFSRWSENANNFEEFDFSNFPVDLFNTGISEGFPENNFDFDDMVEDPVIKED